MEAGKRSGKAVGIVVAVFQGGVDDLHIAGSQLAARQCQPAVPDVFPQRIPAEEPEHPLKMIGGGIALSGDLVIVQVFRDMRFYIINGPLHPHYPIHIVPPYPVCLHTG